MNTNDDNFEHKITFLTSAISDAQELIRFIDTKTAIVITILGAYFVSFFSSFPTIIEYNTYLSCWFWLWQFLFLFFSSITVFITLRIIKPVNNPMDNILINKNQLPSLNFFLPKNTYKNWLYLLGNSKKSKLAIEHQNFLLSIQSAGNDEIQNSLAVEVEKVSFIRNIKNDRFNLLVKCLVITTITFLISFCFITIEINNAKCKKELIQKIEEKKVKLKS